MIEKSSNRDIIYKKVINNNSKDYNEYEINLLKYTKGIFRDKRSFLEYYIFLLKRKQILIFSFYTSDDYNLRTLKISLFFFSLALNYAINTLFYNDESIHEVYEDKGEYNFLSRLINILIILYIR